MKDESGWVGGVSDVTGSVMDWSVMFGVKSPLSWGHGLGLEGRL